MQCFTFVNKVEDFPARRRIADENNLGIEIFCMTQFDVLENRLPETLKTTQKCLQGFKGPIYLHAPYQDIFPATRDPQARELAFRRHISNVQVAQYVGAKAVIVHPYYLASLARNPKYRDFWIATQIDFWMAIMERTEDKEIRFFFENTYEEDVHILNELVDALGREHAGICYDIGHALCFQRRDPLELGRLFGKHIDHVHLHSNDGLIDQHWPPDVGKLDLKAAIDMLKVEANNPTITFEFDAPDDKLVACAKSVQEMIDRPLGAP